MNHLIDYQTNEHIATITLNNPENLNAMDEPMGKEFGKILKSIEKDKSVRVAILTGAGRAFSSGGNLDMIEAKAKKSFSTNKNELKKFYGMYLPLRKLRVPFIAAINGPAIGAGFCLSLACDLRYASTKAKLGANFAKIGLAPGMGGTYFITRLLGPTQAAWVLLLAETFDATKGLEMGLLNGVSEPENLMKNCREIAGKIASNGPLPIAMIKKGIQLAAHQSLEKLFDYDAGNQAKCFQSEDILEGIRAIREKRQPDFKGK